MEEMQKVINYKSNGLLWKFLVVLFVLIMVYIGYTIFIPKEEENLFTYITQNVKKSDLVISVSASGNIQPMEQINVGSEVSGTIEKVFVDYNDVVEKGQLLAQIDKTKYASNLERTKASLSSIEASLENMNAQLFYANSVIQRNKILKNSTKGMLPSKSDWDKDWSTYLGAKAQVESVKAQINQVKQDVISAEYDLEKTNIYSPIDGTILVRSIDTGQTVAASFQTPVLFLIAKDLTKMELQASIDEADIGKVKDGQSASFSVDAYPEKIFSTQINQVRVNSTIVDGVVTFLAIMEFDNSELLLKPGMSADIDIITQTLTNKLIVPKAALLFMPVQPKVQGLFTSRNAPKLKIDSKPHVWILENGVPKKVYVKVLGNSGAQSAIESDEIQENDPIIITQENRK